MASNLTSSNIFVGSTKITDLHSDIMSTHIFTRIDHSSLASLAQASTQFYALCNHESIWTNICNSKWQSTKHLLLQKAISSFPGGHRSFFHNSYPILEFGKYENSCYNRPDTTLVQRPEHLISAVDIQYNNKDIYSKVDVINTSTESFASSSFKVEVLDLKEFVRLPVKEDEEGIHLSDLKENMTLSWIIIDPTQKRAANISSQLPVTVRRHWIDGDIEVKYAIVLPRDRCAGMSSELVELRIIVMLEWEEEKTNLKLRKISLQVNDMDCLCLQGRESLRILQKAIQWGTRKKAKRDEVVDRYKSFVTKKRATREGRQKGQHKITAPLLATFLMALIVPIFLKFAMLW